MRNLGVIGGCPRATPDNKREGELVWHFYKCVTLTGFLHAITYDPK